jgi:hypothetical protein
MVASSIWMCSRLSCVVRRIWHIEGRTAYHSFGVDLVAVVAESLGCVVLEMVERNWHVHDLFAHMELDLSLVKACGLCLWLRLRLCRVLVVQHSKPRRRSVPAQAALLQIVAALLERRKIAPRLRLQFEDGQVAREH